MSFTCNKCGETLSNSKMAGVCLAQLGKEYLLAKGVVGQVGLVKSFDRGEFSAGVLSGLGVKCPECKHTNWR